MLDIATLEAANTARWHAMHIRASRIAGFDATARRLCETRAKLRYQRIAQTVWGKPERWWFVALVHEREAGGPPHWDRQLAQGDPLDKISRHDPVGRGPFLNHADDLPGQDAFYRGALDALLDCPPYAGKWSAWSIGGALTLLEDYNGLGYAAHGVPSAYVWSGSDQYVSGKFVADHVYRPGVIDVQEGCAPLLSRMMALDSSIDFSIDFGVRTA